MKIIIKQYTSPVGELLIGSYGERLCLCDWAAEKRRAKIDPPLFRLLNATYEEGSSPLIEQTIAQLDEYFAGQRRSFDIPLLHTGTEFQCTVRGELMNIPYGATLTYAEIARRIGKPKAIRAVATAIASNPLSILVPCHRVIGSVPNRRINESGTNPRVIGSNGDRYDANYRYDPRFLSERLLTGYAGGLAAKKALLELEYTSLLPLP